MRIFQPKWKKEYLSSPELLDIPEGLVAGEIVDHDDAMCSLIVCAGDGSETFLTGRVPDLQLDFVAVDGEGSDYRWYT
jgi:hypothetical protein